MAKQAWDKVSTAQVIPGELATQVYRHTIPYSQPVPCWTYVTQGMMAHRQKELVITLKRTDATGGEQAPDFVLKLLEYILNLAKQGRTVDAGGYTSMTVAGAAKKEGLPFNLLYLDPIRLPGIPMPSPALTVRFMSVEEYRFFQAFGSIEQDGPRTSAPEHGQPGRQGDRVPSAAGGSRGIGPESRTTPAVAACYIPAQP
jgi:hypothetical protein